MVLRWEDESGSVLAFTPSGHELSQQCSPLWDEWLDR
jgi:hypothetical protein